MYCFSLKNEQSVLIQLNFEQNVLIYLFFSPVRFRFISPTCLGNARVRFGPGEAKEPVRVWLRELLALRACPPQRRRYIRLWSHHHPDPGPHVDRAELSRTEERRVSSACMDPRTLRRNLVLLQLSFCLFSAGDTKQVSGAQLDTPVSEGGPGSVWIRTFRGFSDVHQSARTWLINRLKLIKTWRCMEECMSPAALQAIFSLRSDGKRGCSWDRSLYSFQPWLSLHGGLHHPECNAPEN